MRWTIAQVADALGTRPGTGLNALAWVAGVSIDSRAIRAGELFIAIHGPRHDGHDHVARPLESGAIAAVVAEAELSRALATWSCPSSRGPHRESTRLNARHRRAPRAA